MNDIITLIKTGTATTDEYGDTTYAETSRTVFCEVKSIGYKEFYQASAVGLKPEISFILADYYDYDGEQIVLYGNVRYSVLRTYRNSNRLEIVCSTQVNPSAEVIPVVNT